MRALVALLALLATPLQAQNGWPDLDRLLFGTLTTSGRAEASFWVPDQADPATATRALGIVYEAFPGGNAVSMATGIYQRTTQGWQFAGVVQGLFGNSPREVTFAPTHIDITTTMLGPGEPRCCPTQVTRWRIDLASRVAQRLN